jgi:hypothetical protein
MTIRFGFKTTSDNGSNGRKWDKERLRQLQLRREKEQDRIIRIIKRIKK